MRSELCAPLPSKLICHIVISLQFLLYIIFPSFFISCPLCNRGSEKQWWFFFFFSDIGQEKVSRKQVLTDITQSNGIQMQRKHMVFEWTQVLSVLWYFQKAGFIVRSHWRSLVCRRWWCRCWQAAYESWPQAADARSDWYITSIQKLFTLATAL